MNTRRLLLLAALLLIAAGHPAAQSQVALSCTNRTAAIGDRIDIRLIVTTTAPADALHVEVEGQDFTLLRRVALPRRDTAGMHTLEESLAVTFFNIGTFAVGPFRIQLLRGSTTLENLTAGPLTIKIESVLQPGDKDIKPLKPLLPLVGNPLYLLKYVLLVAGLMLPAALGFLFLRRRKASPLVVAPPLPEQELDSRLSELKSRRLLEKGQVKLLFIQLSGIVKKFLNRYYDLNAEDLTTSEILASTAMGQEENIVRQSLESVFTTADLVKFAKVIPLPDIVNQLFASLAGLVALYQARRQRANAETHAEPGT